MRFDHIITTIARLAIAQAREVRGVVSSDFMRLHEWLASEPLGKSVYLDFLPSPALGGLRINPGSTGMKRGSLHQSPRLTASCPAGIAAV